MTGGEASPKLRLARPSDVSDWDKEVAENRRQIKKGETGTYVISSAEQVDEALVVGTPSVALAVPGIALEVFHALSHGVIRLSERAHDITEYGASTLIPLAIWCGLGGYAYYKASGGTKRDPNTRISARIATLWGKRKYQKLYEAALGPEQESYSPPTKFRHDNLA